jgi:hypothetical protein
MKCIGVFNEDHTSGTFYWDNNQLLLDGNLPSLTYAPSDQLFLARVLADRRGCYLHSSGVNFEGNGLLFVGHSRAGKSTMVTMLKGKAEILCDDRMILRQQISTGAHQPSTGFRIYGTWHHGSVHNVSPNSAPLKAILFLEKDAENRAIRLEDKKEITKRLLACLVKPFLTRDWWEKTFAMIEEITARVPCYVLKFNKTGEVVDVLREL